jgi:Uma2 family endonuclease
MGLPSRKPATYADVLAAPPNLVAQVVDGELITMPRPAPPHAVAASALGEELGPPFKRGRGGPGGWLLLFEPELCLGPDVLVPDLGGWRKERIPVVARTGPFTVAPDWVCEVLSPSSARIDRIRKLPIYARSGVQHAWIVDPELQTLEVFRRDGTTWTLLGAFEGSDRVRAEPFEVFELELGLLWEGVAPP